MDPILDKTDLEIIKLLKINGRAPHTEIGKVLGISEATVRNRVKRLIDENYIQIVAIPNHTKLGYGVTGNIHIKTDVHKITEVLEALKLIDEIEYIVHTSGPAQVEVDFGVEDMDTLHRLLTEKISAIDGLLDYQVYLILQFIKDNYSLDPMN